MKYEDSKYKDNKFFDVDLALNQPLSGPFYFVLKLAGLHSKDFLFVTNRFGFLAKFSPIYFSKV